MRSILLTLTIAGLLFLGGCTITQKDHYSDLQGEVAKLAAIDAARSTSSEDLKDLRELLRSLIALQQERQQFQSPLAPQFTPMPMVYPMCGCPQWNAPQAGTQCAPCGAVADPYGKQ